MKYEYSVLQNIGHVSGFDIASEGGVRIKVDWAAGGRTSEDPEDLDTDLRG